MNELWFTLGPSSLDRQEEILRSGANGVRLTYSYRNPAYQLERALKIRAIADRLGLPCRIVADLAGEKFRLGGFDGPPSVKLPRGTEIRLVREERWSRSGGDPWTVPVRHGNFFDQVESGNLVTVGDGSAILSIVEALPGEAVAVLVEDGVLDQNRGLVVQGETFQPVALTAKDLDDLKAVLSSDVIDVLAISFVDSGETVRRVRDLAREAGSRITILAKIETAQGLENADSICAEADVVMAARGDLALALPWHELPGAVKRIARAARSASKPWILATQIAEGLERFAFPTRAEICDLAHWLEEGCSGVLLSYETAFGSKPVRAVKCTAMLLERWGE